MRPALLTLALLALASGAAPVALAQAPAATVRVRNVQLPAEDLEAVSRFYQDTLGMREVRRLGTPTREVVLGFGATPEAAAADTSARIQLIKYATPPVAYDHSNMALDVPDTAALVPKMVARGGTVVRPPREATISGRLYVLALLKDPAGNIFELVSPK